MKIEHINLVLCDPEPTIAFLQTAFPHWRIRGSGCSDWYGKPRTWLHFGDDDIYIALSDNGEGEGRDLKAHRPGLAHIGLVVDDIEGLMARFAMKGILPSVKLTSIPARRNVYYECPAGIEWEFVQYDSDIPKIRNHYDPAP